MKTKVNTLHINALVKFIDTQNDLKYQIESLIYMRENITFFNVHVKHALSQRKHEKMETIEKYTIVSRSMNA